MAIIIGDIHGEVEKARAFLAYKPDQEHVALGDLIDNAKSGITLADELACLDLLFSSDAVLLWGNHDLAYTREQPWPDHTGHTLSNDEVRLYLDKSEYLRWIYTERKITVQDVLTEQFVTNRARMRVAYAVDGWLCTHAGVGPGVASTIPEGVIAGGSAVIAGWLAEEFEREILVPVPRAANDRYRVRYGCGPLFNIDICRGGKADFGGIFWFDPAREIQNPSPLVGRQIFGHTPVYHPAQGPHWVNLNASEKGIWVFDTAINKVVNLDETI